MSEETEAQLKSIRERYNRSGRYGADIWMLLDYIDALTAQLAERDEALQMEADHAEALTAQLAEARADIANANTQYVRLSELASRYRHDMDEARARLADERGRCDLLQERYDISQRTHAVSVAEFQRDLAAVTRERDEARVECEVANALATTRAEWIVNLRSELAGCQEDRDALAKHAAIGKATCEAMIQQYSKTAESINATVADVLRGISKERYDGQPLKYAKVYEMIADALDAEARDREAQP